MSKKPIRPKSVVILGERYIAPHEYAKMEATNAELLEALECLMRLQSLPSMFRLPSNCEEVIKAKAAIKKARGE